MRVAVATDNGLSPALHAGRARIFLIYDVDESTEWKVIKREERPNPHREFVMERHRAGLHQVGKGEGKTDGSGMGRAGHGPDCGREHGIEQGRGHNVLFRAISDCDVLLAGGMGPRLASDLAARGIKPVVTSEKNIDRALERLIRGKLEGEDFCQEKGKHQLEN